MFIPMWVLYVAGGLIIAHVCMLHIERRKLQKALAEVQLQYEECQQVLEELEEACPDANGPQ
jgi:hypothetical protein